MSNMKRKDQTIGIVEKMIQCADQGPSGFWTDDYEGCGNPNIFPEFEDGLKRGRLVQKEHYLCPWNTVVLFGDSNGNIHTGCYYSCSINEAKYLPEEMLKTVLIRFKKRMQLGEYDSLEYIQPLLSGEEQDYIEMCKAAAEQERELQAQEEQRRKSERAAALLQKYQKNEDICSLLACHYGDNIIVSTEQGCLDFSPNSFSDIVSQKELTYDEYLDIQIRSWGKQRVWFAECYYNVPGEFIGRVEKKSQQKGKICFQQVFVTGMYGDDGSFFNGKEQHVWMDLTGFETFHPGDCVAFSAEVYRYIKTGNGKIMDYGLREPENIRQVEDYQLPSDDDLRRQSIQELICETCFLAEQCNGLFCMREPQELERLKQQMFDIMKEKGEY